MKNMSDSMAYPAHLGALEMPRWKTALSALGALVIAVLFASAGVWKIVDPIDWSTRLAQLKVPGMLALPFTISLGIVEAFAAILILVPRFRRWGAWLAAVLLVVFMAYIGWHYQSLVGADCSCFPWLKRAIGPGFFISDAAMLVAAVAAGIWTRKPDSLRGAAVILAALVVFAGVSYGVAVTRGQGLAAPPSIAVNGQPFDLQQGWVLLYFYDPECSHCYQAAQTLAQHRWKDVRIVGVPTRVPQFAQSFLDQSGLRAAVTTDVEPLRKLWTFRDPPYGVVLENGRQKAVLNIFDEREPTATLRQLGLIE